MKPPAVAKPRPLFVPGLVLAGLALLAYLPALGGTFLWDDDNFLTANPLIHAADGLRRFWLTGQAADYWPLTSSTLWAEWRLWGLHPLGYHATNIALHLVCVLLLWRVLARLGVPGAFWGALLFAVHPVNVESVAWITQRKNLVAMVFFLLSVRWFLAGERDYRWRAPSVVAFALAMLGKGSVAPLPLVLAGIIAWRRRLRGRDFRDLAPYFVIAVVLAWVNVRFETHDYAPFRTAGFLERLLGAAAAIWFYLGKALWPADLSFVYPQWTIRIGDPAWWAPLAAAAGLTAVLWRFRRRSAWVRGGLFAWGYFCVMLGPALGFTDVGFMKFSLVADHYQHLALLGVTAFAGAALAAGVARLDPALRFLGWAGAGLAAAILLGLTVRQNRIYADPERLYSVALERSPASALAHNNLGVVLAEQPGRQREAEAQFAAAMQADPAMAEAHYNLGNLLVRAPDGLPRAVDEFAAAVRLNPRVAALRNNLGRALAASGQPEEAIPEFRAAARLAPAWAAPHINLANTLAARPDGAAAAAEEYAAALRLDPRNVEAENNLANVLAALPGRQADAVAHYEAALRLAPGLARVHANLAAVLAELGRTAQARAEYDAALRLDPELAAARAGREALPAR